MVESRKKPRYPLKTFG